MRFPLRTKAELEQDPSKERTIDLTLSDDQLLPFARFLLKKLAGLEVRHKRGSAIHLEDSEVTTISILGTIKLEDKDDVPHVMIFDFDDEVEEDEEEDEEDEEEDEPRNLICGGRQGGLAIEDMLDCGVCEPPRPTNWVCSVCGKSITTNLRNMTCETCNGRPPGM